MDSWPPGLMVAIVVLGLIAVYATLLYGVLSQGGGLGQAVCLANVAGLAYIGVVVYVLRDWWEG